MKKLQLDEFTRYQFLSGIEFSPDGKTACFAVHKANMEDNGYDSNLWLYEGGEEGPRQLTGFNQEGNFLWLQDGKHLIFSSTRDKKDKERLEKGEVFTKYYRIHIYGGEAQPYFTIPLRVTGIKQVDEDTFLFTAVDHPLMKDLSNCSEEEKAKELKKRKEEKDYEVLEEIPFWSNGGGYTSKKRNRLYSYSLSSGTYQAISKEGLDVEIFNLNEGKNKVVISYSANPGRASLTNSLVVVDLATGAAKEILPEGTYHCAYVNFIDDEHIFFVGGDMKRYGINENSLFYKIHIPTGKVTCLTPGLDTALYNSVGSDCRYGASPSFKKREDAIYFVTTEGFNSYLNRFDLITYEIQRLTTAPGSVDGYAVDQDTILLIAMRDGKLQELYRLTEEEEIQITCFNQWVVEERKLSVPEPLQVKTEPGVVIDGWVMKPVDYEPGKQYPAILDIHGGPKTVYGEVFYHEMQYWANEGYFVFFCNPRGSDGRGNEFADIRGKYGTIDYEDIMAFTDQVLTQYPDIDPARVGVTGGSYGGFMTNWIVGHTTRFSAAATQRSISNWISKFGTTDIGYYFVDDQQGATPWSNADKLWWHSPLKYADQVKTPTLIIHSDEDYRCWITEAYQFFTALKYHGVDARMCIFRGENHELTRSGKPKHRIRNLEEITGWFDKYLK